MRPIYETKEDRDREEWVANYISHKTGVELHRHPVIYRFDWFAHYNNLRYEIEIKCRNIIWGQYESIFISRKKLVYGYQSTVNGSPFIFVVKTRDNRLFRYLMTKKNARALKTRIGGRVDRNDPQDIEAVVHIPIGMFIEL